MAQNNNGYPGYDPRYDPRYQQQYGYPQQMVEVQVPMVAYNHHGAPQQNYRQPQQTHPGFPQAPYTHPAPPQIQHQYHHAPPPPLPPPVPAAPAQITSNGSMPINKILQSPVMPVILNAPTIPAPLPPPPPPPPAMDIDYSLLLIDLAENYFMAAYGGGPKKLPGLRNEPEMFCKTIATGLGCLEVCLKEWKSTLQPYVEAAIRLRYSSIIYKETENFMEAEETLSKGISQCERYRLLDLKYNMQHLLSRVTFAKNSKAALRYLDGIIKDVETVHHIPWIYAFRFLRVSLALKMSYTQEILIAISQLKVISNLAVSRGDHAVSAAASATEALIHINRSNSLDNIEQAQRALAITRSSQLDPHAQKIHQITVMAYFVDLCCSIHQNDPRQASSKLTAMNTFLDQHVDDRGWTSNGEIKVVMSRATVQNLSGTGTADGVIEFRDDESVSIRIQWLPKDEIYTLGYMLSAATVLHKNAQDGQKAEIFLREAANMLDMGTEERNIEPHNHWRSQLRCQIQVQTVFALCVRSAWGTARKELSVLKEMVPKLPTASAPSLPFLIEFLDGSISQGTGETDTAFSIYNSPLLALSSDTNSTSPIQRDISILAALNKVLIIHLPSHPDHSHLPGIMASLESLALENPSKDIHAAYYLIRAISLNTGSSESGSLLKTKQYLQHALQAAKSTVNNQLCCITLNFMSWKFFRGVVGDQPQKSALSAQSLARKGQNSLWMSVADGLLAETLETQGKLGEAEQVRREGREIAGRLPLAMQRDADMQEERSYLP